MRFGEALEALKNGQRVRRATWLTKGYWLELNRPAGGARVGEPFIAKDYGSYCAPWVASHMALLAEDWEVLD